MEITTWHGAIEGKTQIASVDFYHLDAIISVGYHVNSALTEMHFVFSKSVFVMIKAITIQNFKSITSASLDLGHINVFIGANGSGKSNILEAIGMVASERSSQIEINAMMQKGVRIAKPNLMVSSFYGQASNGAIEVKISGTDGEWMEYNVSNPTPEDIYSTWVATCGIRGRKGADADRMEKGKKELRDYLSKYLIYSLSVDALRGFTANSMQYPLGINGEGLDVLLNNLPKEEIIQIKEAAKEYIDWIEDIWI